LVFQGDKTVEIVGIKSLAVGLVWFGIPEPTDLGWSWSPTVGICWLSNKAELLIELARGLLGLREEVKGYLV
jgi:hypothetical protein